MRRLIDFIPWPLSIVVLLTVIGLAGCLGGSLRRSLPSSPAAPAAVAPAPTPVPAPPVSPPKPETLAQADDQISRARAEVEALTAQLAFAKALVAVKEEGRVQLAKDAERDARQAQAATQARWLTWIAGLIFVAGIAATIAGFWLPIPKRWGAYTALGGLALMIASRVWTWAGDHSLAIGLGALAIAGAFGARAWWRTASAARHIAQVGDRLEGSYGAMADWVKADAAEIQKKTGMTDLVRRLRGKPKPKPEPTQPDKGA